MKPEKVAIVVSRYDDSSFVVVALMMLAFMCPIMLPALRSGAQQTCQQQICWLLERVPSPETL